MSNDHFIAYAHSLWPDIVSRQGHDPTEFIGSLLKLRDQAGSERIVLGLASDSEKMIFKCRAEGANPKPIEVEIEATTKAHRAMAGRGRFMAPKLLASSASDGWLLQSFEPGVTAKKIIEIQQDEPDLGREMRGEILTVAGAWLAAFHASGGAQETFVQTATMRAHGDDVLASLLTKEIDPATAETFRQLGAVIHARAREADGAQTRAGVVHGDFVPQNVLVHKDQVTGLDFSALHTGPNAHDQVKFLARLYWDCPPELVSEADFAADVTAFEAGYGRDIEDDPAFSYLMPIQVLLDLAHPRTSGQRRDNLLALARLLVADG